MQQKIENIDWDRAAKDVAPFLNTRDRSTLNLWGVNFFTDKLNKLKDLIDF